MCSGSLLGLTETGPDRRGAYGGGAAGGKDGMGFEFGIGSGSGSLVNPSGNGRGSQRPVDEGDRHVDAQCDDQTTGSRRLRDQLYGRWNRVSNCPWMVNHTQRLSHRWRILGALCVGHDCVSAHPA